MTKVKTADLIGPALDWAVWLAERDEPGYPCKTYKHIYMGEGKYWAPSTDWSQGGVLIDKFGLAFMKNSWPNTDDSWIAVDHERESCGQGTTHLIASCRAIVAANLGDEVEIPDELVLQP